MSKGFLTGKVYVCVGCRQPGNKMYGGLIKLMSPKNMPTFYSHRAHVSLSVNVMADAVIGAMSGKVNDQSGRESNLRVSEVSEIS